MKSVCLVNACEWFKKRCSVLGLMCKLPTHGDLCQGFIISYKLKRKKLSLQDTGGGVMQLKHGVISQVEFERFALQCSSEGTAAGKEVWR